MKTKPKTNHPKQIEAHEIVNFFKKFRIKTSFVAKKIGVLSPTLYNKFADKHPAYLNADEQKRALELIKDINKDSANVLGLDK